MITLENVPSEFKEIISNAEPLKIYVKRFDKTVELPTVNPKGDWVDLYSSVDIDIKRGERMLVDLGIAIVKPSGCEGWLAVRSSTFKTWKVMQANPIGIMDQPYEGEEDHWMLNVIAFEDTHISKGDKIAQFRIAPSQKASVIDKLNWLFSQGIEIVEVDKVGDSSRGGFGTTGTK